MEHSIEATMPGLIRFRARKPIVQEQFANMIRSRSESNELRLASLEDKQPTWNIGFVSRKGNVRARNEDYGTAFVHQDHQVIIMGDGLGGASHGDLASFMAVEAASWVLLDRLQKGMAGDELQKVSSDAIWTAGQRLAWMGDKLNVSQSGLRTTLIILIANSEYAALTYIGDGAVYHYKAPTDCQQVLHAHKAMPGNLSLLSASLGPTVHGQQRSRLLNRTESDLFLLMSDGIADRIQVVEKETDSDCPPELISNIVGLAVLQEGDLQKTAESAIETLEAEKDEKEYLCDDNISLGLIGNLKSPQIL